MVRNITIESYRKPVTEQRVEIVERKGIGHPDTICDSIMDRVSVELCREYIKRCGHILHHNIDKGFLAAGSVDICFGGGIVREPMLFVFGDRATYDVDGEAIAVDEIAISTAKRWLKRNMRFIDPNEHVRYQVELRPGSAELVDIFKRGGKVLGANDTSVGVGYAPLSPTEKIALETEKFLNSKNFKKNYPETGEDIKVMAMRENHKVLLTVALAFVDRFIKNEKDYFRKKDEVTQEINEFVLDRFGNDFKKINLTINTLDRKGRGIGGCYLTVTGTSLEAGDSGQVGRGNRLNGIIPFNRASTTEAAAGKNPVSHVGKIYNALTHRIANKIYRNVDGIEEIYIWLLSQIGKPIDKPTIAAAQVALEPNIPLERVEKAIHREMDHELEHIDKFCLDLANGRVSIC